jgi:hypothetical protein
VRIDEEMLDVVGNWPGWMRVVGEEGMGDVGFGAIAMIAPGSGPSKIAAVVLHRRLRVVLSE